MNAIKPDPRQLAFDFAYESELDPWAKQPKPRKMPILTALKAWEKQRYEDEPLRKITL